MHSKEVLLIKRYQEALAKFLIVYNALRDLV